MTCVPDFLAHKLVVYSITINKMTMKLKTVA